jgi:thymidine kinase
MELIPLAEHVIKLTAVCMSCFGEGSYTKRISDEKEVCSLVKIILVKPWQLGLTTVPYVT